MLTIVQDIVQDINVQDMNISEDPVGRGVRVFFESHLSQAK